MLEPTNYETDYSIKTFKMLWVSNSALYTKFSTKGIFQFLI